MLGSKPLARRLPSMQGPLARASRRVKAFPWNAQRIVLLAILALAVLAALPRLVGNPPLPNICLVTADFW
jgi:hypothetical protein